MARPPKERFDASRAPQLQPDLQKIWDRVGKQNYARATAKHFATGGDYHPEKNRGRRYALT